MPILVTVEGELAIVLMEEPSANAINPAFIAAIHAALDEVARADVGAAVLTGAGEVFSAGLDLVYAHALDRDGMGGFVDLFEAMFERVFSFEKPLVAAVNGHAIAGGGILLLACDARVFLPGRVAFALAEVDLGIPFPAGAFEIARQAIPRAYWADAFFAATGFHTAFVADALELGTLAKDGDVVGEARQIAKRFVKPSRAVTAAIKADLVAPTLALIERGRAARRERFLDAWFGEAATRLRGERVSRFRPRAG